MHSIAIHPEETPMAEHCRRIRVRLADAELARVAWEELTWAERERVRRWVHQKWKGRGPWAQRT